MLPRSARLLVSCFLLLSLHARADWIVVGAAYKCEPGRAFALEATMDTSSPNDPGTVRAKSGFTELKPDRTSILKCTVGQAEVRSKIRVTSPRAQGMCAGSGDVSIEQLQINGQRVLAEQEPFNIACVEGPAIISIRVRASESLTEVEVCRGEWAWGIGYENIQCEAKRV